MIEKYREFIDENRDAVLLNETFLDGLFDSSKALSSEEKSSQFETLVEEAEETLNLIADWLDPGKRILEVGGGAALTYAFLRTQGFKVVSIEPSTGGFRDRFHSGQVLLRLLGIEDDGWKPLRCSEIEQLNEGFDLIFSNFVMEHVTDIDESFAAMTACLSDDGVMIHRCPNYTFPFEPHYNIPLIPGAPRSTELLNPRLKKKPLWNELQFTTVSQIRKLCHKCDLRVKFEWGMLRWAFARTFDNPMYRSRKLGIARIARILRSTGILNLLAAVPPRFATPMTFVARRTNT